MDRETRETDLDIEIRTKMRMMHDLKVQLLDLQLKWANMHGYFEPGVQYCAEEIQVMLELRAHPKTTEGRAAILDALLKAIGHRLALKNLRRLVEEGILDPATTEFTVKELALMLGVENFPEIMGTPHDTPSVETILENLDTKGAILQ